MPPEYRVISMGTLARHPLWEGAAAPRTPHATTTLVTSGDERILINPSLPATILLARLSERTPIMAEEMTQVFLTNLMPDHCRGLGAFPKARWLASEAELQSATAHFRAELEEAEEHDDHDTTTALHETIGLLEKISPAPDKLAEGVDLFPLPGMTAGTCGLLISQPRATVLVAGDAVATVEHLERGQVLQQSQDLEQAQESFREAVEIADVIVPGRDNAIPVR